MLQDLSAQPASSCAQDTEGEAIHPRLLALSPSQRWMEMFDALSWLIYSSCLFRPPVTLALHWSQ